MNILIATATLGTVRPENVRSVVNLQVHLGQHNVGWGYQTLETSDMAFGRNVLASYFHEHPQFTHLLFADGEIVFRPSTVQLLIDAAKPLVGCICPRRQLDFDKLLEAAKLDFEKPLAVASAMEFIIRHKPGVAKIEVSHGLCNVAGIGMGLCLIGRQVCADLAATGKLSSRSQHPFGHTLKGPVLGFFDPIPAETGYLTEDFSFCERWTSLCGGEVWGLASEDVGRVGNLTFRARYVDALRAKQLRPPSDRDTVH